MGHTFAFWDHRLDSNIIIKSLVWTKPKKYGIVEQSKLNIVRFLQFYNMLSWWTALHANIHQINETIPTILLVDSL